MSTQPSVEARTPPLAAATNKRRQPADFRPDIQGLRAVAVVLVALSHAGVANFAGGYVGVDVFFVISGFLITGWILRHSERAGHVPIWEFYAARARRILPAAALTLVATTIASYYLLNFLAAQGAFHDSVWAAFFAANIHFARLGTNYFGSSAPPSPIQHYWSLAVEEQFYLAWPAVVLLVLPWPTRRNRARRQKRRRRLVTRAARRRLTLTLGVCVLASLAWSIHDTTSDPIGAYFSTFARAWELGVGGLIAVTTGSLARIPEPIRAVMSWVGLAGVFVAAMTYSSTTAFPGYAALLPVLSAGLIITGGLGDRNLRGATLVLGRQPLRFVGDVSYSFYLWHWPVLIIAAQYEGHGLTAATNVILLAGAFALSVVTYLGFERPIHRGKALSRPWLGLSLWPVSIAAVVLTAVVGLGAIQQTLHRDLASESTSTTTGTDPVPPSDGTSGGTGPYIEAVAAAVGPAGRSESVPPSVFVQMENLGARDFKDCITPVGNNTSSPLCNLGAAHATRTLVVYGDSHAQMWLTALSYFAQHNNWRLVPVIKESCVPLLWSGHPDAPAPTDVLGAPNQRAQRTRACVAWHSWAVQQLKKLHPSAIIYGTAYAWEPDTSATTMGYNWLGLKAEIALLQTLAPKVVMLQDTPYWLQNPVDCLLAHGATVGSCTLPLSASLIKVYSQVDVGLARVGVKVESTLQWFCGAGKCPSVVADTIVYRDTEHISSTYATYLEGPLAGELTSALG